MLSWMILDTSLVSVVPFPLSIPKVLIISHIVWIHQPHEDPKLLTYVCKWSLHAKELDPKKEVILPCFSKSLLSTHPGGVKWIIISSKDFGRPRWIKRFLHICNYVEELSWLWNQKYSCCITQVCFHESTILKECLIMVSKAIQLLTTLSLPMWSSVEPLPTKIETSSISSISLDVLRVCHLKSCLLQFLHELTMRYLIF
jgi:hypothetical protein